MDSEQNLISLLYEFHNAIDIHKRDASKSIPHIIKLIYAVSSMHKEFESQPPETKLMSLTAQMIACFKSMDLDSQPDPLRNLVSLVSREFHRERKPEVSRVLSLLGETMSLNPVPEIIPLIEKILSLDLDSLYPEHKLKTLINQLIFLDEADPVSLEWIVYAPKFISLCIEIISRVSSVDWDSQPKADSELMSLINQTVSVFNSMDTDSQPEPLKKLISLASRSFSFVKFRDSDSELDTEFFDLLDVKLEGNSTRKHILVVLHYKLLLLVAETMSLEPEPEFISLIHQIISLVMSMNSDWKNLISLCPQVQVILEEGIFHVAEQGSWRRNAKWDYLHKHSGVEEGEYAKRKDPCKNSNKWDCLPFNCEKLRSPEKEDATHFLCYGCFGENHKENNKASVEIKHPLHPKHSLQLALFLKDGKTRQCYCCDKQLGTMFYYCLACDFGISISCTNKQQVLSIDHPKWHQHTLHLFPSQAPLTCGLCALTHSSCPFYICPRCDFVIHQRCITLPHVIKISRHPHRISFTHSFQKGDWSCGICRRNIHNDYGGYSCIKKGCSFAAHSKCATQSNVWDGIELEGLPEEEITELEPFVTISDGVIQHFSHEHHHLKLDDNTGKDYDEYKICQACITPIYFGNFYSCLECDFILHQECAKLSRRLHHPIHSHLLILVTYNYLDGWETFGSCSACPSLGKRGFFYECSGRKCEIWQRCHFKLHVLCTTISEPLVHPSHMHPLFLTSKPDEERKCLVCNKARDQHTKETFNCIEEECDFALCFGCATLPQKVRYKHDQHFLHLSYGKKTSTMTYWCEACEGKINPEEGFYNCNEYCCVNLHLTCMLGMDLYVMPGSSFLYEDGVGVVRVQPNSMSRPTCYFCKNPCPQKIVFINSFHFFCSMYCIHSWNAIM